MLQLNPQFGQCAFIADLHLSADRPDITQAFLQFLSEQTQLDALFIMGDLFEYWIGDDIAEPFALDVADAIAQAAQHYPIYFSHGNRDFLVDKEFAKRSQMTLLPEVQALDLYGTKALVAHGDSLCTDDKAYQKFRRFRNHNMARWLFMRLPQRRRQKIADNLRQNSAKSKQMKSEAIMDVNPTAVDALLNRFEADVLIHGHTHRPKLHQLATGKQRWVVGDWYTQGSYLMARQGEPELIQLPLAG
ncbi:UDP-2,3-diacylglucosamine hydrolase [Paraferrimonas sedimenticola]|uniref:UDP-2,3-diacylglucosamine hydrolase n=1 Tax=Paraferrimonas sedimenticola TaxID=375674 RepID=A0AA37W0V4_9GAMM|nr:UDP-2,3-diacylglucosamine hydrolase [Paraferrimonas sedimenticola]